MPDIASYEVIYTQYAVHSIKAIGTYITLKGYPDTAQKFILQLFDFGNTLSIFPEKYPVSHFKTLSTRGLRVATFRKNYVFIYKIDGQKVIVYNVVNTKTRTENWI